MSETDSQAGDDAAENSADSHSPPPASPLIFDDDDFLGIVVEPPDKAPNSKPEDLLDHVTYSPTPTDDASDPSEAEGEIEEAVVGKLCPRCMRLVPRFTKGKTANDSQYSCPSCDEVIQFRYAEDFDQVSRVQLSLAGMSGHGKTMFLRGIYAYLNSLGRKWHGFRFLPLSDDDAQSFRLAIGENKIGELANPSQLVERPVGFQLCGIPGIGAVHLLLYDISGEAFDTSRKLGRHAYFIPRSNVITLILSLTDLENGQELAFLLGRLMEAIRLNGRDPREKSLVVVLTKGDRLKADSTLPDSATAFLSNELPIDPCDMESLHTLSDDLEDWLQQHPENYWNFVQTAKEEFRTVRYTVISSIGSEPTTSDVHVQMNPRNVISPLLWLLRLSLPRITTHVGDKQITFHDVFEASRAVAASSERMELRFGPGRFQLQKSVQLNSTVVLSGDGPNQTQIVVNKRNVHLTAEGGGLAVKGISFIVSGEATGAPLTITDTKFSLNDCSFSGGKREGKVLGNGLLVNGGSTGEIHNCQFRENESHGITVAGSSSVEIRNCEASGNEHAGYAFSANAKALSENNRASQNNIGFQISGNSEATLRDCESISNTLFGIGCEGDSKGVLENNKCWNGRNEAHVPKQSVGILLSGNTAFSVTGNQCSGHRRDGITARRNTQSELKHNTLTGNVVCGIGVYERAVVTVMENDCSRNRYGIHVQSTARGTKVARNNKCFRNSRYGVQNLRSWAWRPIAFWANLFNDPVGPDPPV